MSTAPGGLTRVSTGLRRCSKTMNATLDREADAETAQEIGEHNRHDGDGERDEVAVAQVPGVPPERRRGEAEAGHQQHRGDRGQRDAVEHGAERQHRHQHQRRVHHHRQARPRPGIDVGRGPDHHAGERQPAQQSRQDVAGPLGHQLAIHRGVAPQRIQLARGLEVEERLEAGDERDDHRELPHHRGGQRAPVGKHEMRCVGAAADRRQRHQVRAAHGELGEVDLEQLVDADAAGDGDERRGQQAKARKRRARPPQHHGHPDQRRDHGADLNLLERGRQRAQRGLAGGLDEGQVALGVAVVADGVRHLLEDQRDPDAREHALDHRGRHVIRHRAGPRRAQQQLQPTGQHHRGKQPLEAAHLLNAQQDDGGEARGRAADHQRRTGQRPHHEAADHAGDHARNEGRARRRPQSPGTAARRRGTRRSRPARRRARCRRTSYGRWCGRSSGAMSGSAIGAAMTTETPA